ncbi:MAG TPA: GNAT family N-acetyltransferase [Candidatus Angelobacter sp.]|nr:GNAT family N-acetyltransferase [Candidatus Angelobacter sp.]
MAAFVIRPYREADRAAVIAAEIGLQEYERTLHDTRLPGAAVMEAYLDRLLQQVATQSGAILVAEESGRLLGLVACVVVQDDAVQETADSNIHGYITDIYVVPERRGSGLAQALLQAAETHLAPTGISRVRISVLAANAMARRAYEKHGFEPYEVMYEKRLGQSD